MRLRADHVGVVVGRQEYSLTLPAKKIFGAHSVLPQKHPSIDQSLNRLPHAPSRRANAAGCQQPLQGGRPHVRAASGSSLSAKALRAAAGGGWWQMEVHRSRVEALDKYMKRLLDDPATVRQHPRLRA